MRYNQNCAHLIYSSLMLVIYLAGNACPGVKAKTSVTTFRDDAACGPKCLRALMQITGVGDSDCDIKCIYRYMAKNPMEPTTMKDLKYAAHKLGFSAEGFKLDLDGLRKEKGYTIVPLGKNAGTKDDNKHFVLVYRVNKDNVIYIDTQTFKQRVMPLSHFEEMWNGYSLVIRKYGKYLLEKNPADISARVEDFDEIYEAIKDFGKVERHTTLKHLFEIDIQKYEPCTLKIIGKSCSCLEVDLEKVGYGRAKLSMSMKVNKPGLQQNSAAIELLPSRVVKQYAIRAFGNHSYKIEPSVAYLEVTDNGTVTYPIKVEYYVSYDEHVEFVCMHTEIKDLTTGHVKSRVRAYGDTKTKRYAFDIPLVYTVDNVEGRVKHIDGIVNFTMNTVKGRIELPLEFKAVVGTEKYLMSPEKAFMIVSKSNGSNQTSVSLKFMQSAPRNISVIEADKTCPIHVELKRIDEGEILLTLRADQDKIKDTQKGLHEWEVGIIWSDDTKNTSISLPVRLVLIE